MLPFDDESFAIGNEIVEMEIGRITKGSETIRLQPKARGVLELLNKVWNGCAVTENVIPQCISTLRSAFAGDSSVSIETIPTIGYRLLATIRPIERSLIHKTDQFDPTTKPSSRGPQSEGAHTGSITRPMPSQLPPPWTSWKVMVVVFVIAVIVRILLFGHSAHLH
jgi:DNA-binding winged helix-turn-helix (wHTH) protein